MHRVCLQMHIHKHHTHTITIYHLVYVHCVLHFIAIWKKPFFPAFHALLKFDFWQFCKIVFCELMTSYPHRHLLLSYNPAYNFFISHLSSLQRGSYVTPVRLFFLAMHEYVCSENIVMWKIVPLWFAKSYMSSRVAIHPDSWLTN